MGEPLRLCVFCRAKPIDPQWQPFCSERCRLQDLARWADGSYSVAAEPVTEPQSDDNTKSDH
jgi:endogenous inhibitor of DNA gyrase (YacG/DUF329 family)